MTSTGAPSRGCATPPGSNSVSSPEGPVELTLSMESSGSADSGTVRVFRGPIQGYNEFEIGTEATTIEVEIPEKLDRPALSR